MPRARLERFLGLGVLALALVGICVLVANRSVRAELSRVGQALTGGGRSGDRTLAVSSVEGIEPGLPLYRMSPAGDAQPVAHVLAVRADPPRVRLRPAPGESLHALSTLTVFPPSRKLSAALALAVPEDEAQAFAAALGARAEHVWTTTLWPSLEKKFPAFLARIDPTRGNRSKVVLDEVTQTLLTQLEPVADDALGRIMSAVRDELSALDSLGLLWDLVRGDAEGIKEALLPHAKKAAGTWWSDNRARVLDVLGGSLSKHWPAIREWMAGELLDATLDELVKPMWAEHRPRLEREGERVMRDAVRRFVEAPGGGFRIRFSSLLRQNLLNKKTALLLWLPQDLGNDDGR